MGPEVSIVNSFPFASLLIPLHSGGNGSWFNGYFNPTVEIEFIGSRATMEMSCPFEEENDRLFFRQ